MTTDSQTSLLMCRRDVRKSLQPILLRSDVTQQRAYPAGQATTSSDPSWLHYSCSRWAASVWCFLFVMSNVSASASGANKTRSQRPLRRLRHRTVPIPLWECLRPSALVEACQEEVSVCVRVCTPGCCSSLDAPWFLSALVTVCMMW